MSTDRRRLTVDRVRHKPPSVVRRLRSIPPAPFLAGLLLLAACMTNTSETDFHDGLEAWRTQRYADLQKPDGYLSLAGLYWLEDGEYSFGSDSSNSIVLPVNAPLHIGTLVVLDSVVTMRVRPEVKVTADGEAVSERVMVDDSEGSPTIAHLDSLNWRVISRSRGLAIRLLDRESPTRRAFDGIDFFEPDQRWRLEAHFEPYDPPLEIAMPSITGVDEKDTVPGVVVFEVEGTEYRLDVTGQPGDDRYFVVFGDATSGQETYGGGRFVWIDAEDDEGNIIIDFNRAYNPPCVFSPFATCPLPTPNNRLPIRIEAGELNYGGH